MDGRFAMDLNELDQDIFIRLSAQGAAQDPVLDPALQICILEWSFHGELSGFIVVSLNKKDTYASEPQFRGHLPRIQGRQPQLSTGAPGEKHRLMGWSPAGLGGTHWPCSWHHMVRCSGQSEMPGTDTLPPTQGGLKKSISAV